MAQAKKTPPSKAAGAKTAKKSSVAKKVAKKAKPVLEKTAKAAVPADLSQLDRKSLAAKARQIKTELLSIRFNLQAPNLKDFRKKKEELVKVLSQLG
jgi:hypothetical protein